MRLGFWALIGLMSAVGALRAEVMPLQVRLTADGVQVSREWTQQSGLHFAASFEAMEESIRQLPFVAQFRRYGEDAPTRQVDSAGLVTEKQNLFYLLQGPARLYPKMMVSFQKIIQNCAQARTESCENSLSFKLQAPFHLYQHQVQFPHGPLDIESLQLELKLSETDGTWKALHQFKIKNLFFFQWLKRMQQSLRLQTVPTTHELLLQGRTLLVTLDESLQRKLGSVAMNDQDAVVNDSRERK